MSDEDLVEAWRQGDRAAGNALFERHFDEIYNFFSRKVADDVSDLVQRTFLGCVEGIERFRGDCSPRTYLYAIARNELYAYLRRKKRDESLDFGVSSLGDMGPSPSSMLARHDEAALLVSALERLPLDLQILVELRYWEGLKGRELAVVLDIPHGTVSSRLRRSLALLREHMVEQSKDRPAHLADEKSFEAWAESVHPYELVDPPAGETSTASRSNAAHREQ